MIYDLIVRTNIRSNGRIIWKLIFLNFFDFTGNRNTGLQFRYEFSYVTNYYFLSIREIVPRRFSCFLEIRDKGDENP